MTTERVYVKYLILGDGYETEFKVISVSKDKKKVKAWVKEIDEATQGPEELEEVSINMTAAQRKVHAKQSEQEHTTRLKKLIKKYHLEDTMAIEGISAYYVGAKLED